MNSDSTTSASALRELDFMARAQGRGPMTGPQTTVGVEFAVHMLAGCGALITVQPGGTGGPGSGLPQFKSLGVRKSRLPIESAINCIPVCLPKKGFEGMKFHVGAGCGPGI